MTRWTHNISTGIWTYRVSQRVYGTVYQCAPGRYQAAAHTPRLDVIHWNNQDEAKQWVQDRCEGAAKGLKTITVQFTHGKQETDMQHTPETDPDLEETPYQTQDAVPLYDEAQVDEPEPEPVAEPVKRTRKTRSDKGTKRGPTGPRGPRKPNPQRDAERARARIDRIVAGLSDDARALLEPDGAA